MAQNEERKDRIAGYLKQLNEGILFDELSADYLKRAHVDDILIGVPVPIAVGGDEELSTLSIAYNMARIVGSDRAFPYTKQYLEYIERLLGEDLSKALISKGVKDAENGNYEVACMYFRAVLVAEPQNRDALYLYGRACKDAYEVDSEDEAYVGSFKAESIEVFEILTMMYPDFAMGYYFLGFGYANLGLYQKADLTWKTFLELTAGAVDPEVDELKKEIQERVDQLVEPVKIEEGVNCVLRGDYQQGLDILSQYTEGNYKDWWPLWYYMAVCAASLGDAEGAIDCYKQVLVYTPSNIDVMEELVSVYQAIGDGTNAQKYMNKIELVKKNLEEEQAEKAAKQ